MRRTKEGEETIGAGFNRYNLWVPWFDINSVVYVKDLNEIFVYMQPVNGPVLPYSIQGKYQL